MDISQVTMQDLAREWKSKHDQVRSGRFSWVESRWLGPARQASFSRFSKPGPNGGPGVNEDAPLLRYDNTLIFDGERMRFERVGEEWHPRKSALLTRHHIGVWDGSVGTVLRLDEDFAHAEIYALGWDLTQRPLFPFRVAFRMLHPQWYSLQLDEFVFRREHETFEGHQCLVIESSPEDMQRRTAQRMPPWRYSYWISPVQDFSVVRFQRSQDSLPRPSEEISVSYRRDAQHGWYPARWRIVDGSSDPPKEIIDAEVTEYAINQPVDSAAFALELPDGTWTRDLSPDITSTESFIARADGERRPVTRAELERGATYEELLATESGAAALTPVRPRWLTWAVWVTSGVVSVLVLTVALRHRRANR